MNGGWREEVSSRVYLSCECCLRFNLSLVFHAIQRVWVTGVQRECCNIDLQFAFLASVCFVCVYLHSVSIYESNLSIYLSIYLPLCLCLYF